MRRRPEHGGVPWYLMFTIAAAIGTGFGVYRVLHQRELRLADERARAPKHVPKPVEPAREPTVEEAKPEEIEMPADQVAVVMIGTPRIDGELEGVGVELAVAAQREAIERCYTGVVAQGALEISLFADPRGRPSSVTAGAEPFDSTLASCVEDLIKTLRFPRPANGESARIVIPILFSRS